MAMNDTVADMLTRIRNGLVVNRSSVDVIASKLNRSVANVLEREGFLVGVTEVLDSRGHKALRLALKYDRDGASVITKIGRVSRPGRRVYRGVQDIPRVLNGLGISVVSTSRGVLSDREARGAGVGGEILCEIW
ncbi:MAG: 30S ribosomal protein S8 [Planctomycetes bacterium]|nr:30S ribosomal protein S8 [Planctomycetota bacterium]MCB9825844.1 30S ribosomal protein S8 [Planctomycetota bacterium]MCB9829129.1 30S ribosomal protein S8 [Planctomycetota bacterium]MCB9901243.1 30S ribosomal protein S8 [Planctomycetota bacterium]